MRCGNIRVSFQSVILGSSCLPGRMAHGERGLNQTSHGAVADGPLQLKKRMDSPWERSGKGWARFAARDLLLQLLWRFGQTLLRHKHQLRLYKND
jgi:hypothetical protein